MKLRRPSITWSYPKYSCNNDVMLGFWPWRTGRKKLASRLWLLALTHLSWLCCCRNAWELAGTELRKILFMNRGITRCYSPSRRRSEMIKIMKLGIFTFRFARRLVSRSFRPLLVPQRTRPRYKTPSGKRTCVFRVRVFERPRRSDFLRSEFSRHPPGLSFSGLRS